MHTSFLAILLFASLGDAIFIQGPHAAAHRSRQLKLGSKDEKGLTLPSFPQTQHVTGLVSLPYAELDQPFEFWQSPSMSGASRVDWYGGLDTTLTRPDVGTYGTQFSFSYALLDGSDDLRCFEVAGDAGNPAPSTVILPDLSNFTYQGQVTIQGRTVDYLLLKTQVMERENTYKFYYTQDGSSYTPVQYSFLGYDTLLGSHYDRYDVFYYSFDDNVTDDVFKYNEQFTCGAFPGPGDAESQMRLNPLEHLMDPESRTLDTAFEDYKKQFSKSYTDQSEHSVRRHAFLQNLRLIHGKNKQRLSFRLAVNHLADTTEEERGAQLGSKRIDDGRVPSALVFNPEHAAIQDLPDYWDWRLHGAVTQVKDQAICGSCWSFGTTGTLEGALFLKHGSTERLSQQNLMDCSWNQGNNGCGGGEDWRAYDYIQTSYGGLMTEADYGHYLGQNGKCHFDSSKGVIDIANYTFVKGQDPDKVKTALVNNGPLSIGINAALPTFSFYSHGIYNDPDCHGADDDLDHSVLLVGFGQLSGTDYWLVKNSWSTYWGNLGYVTFQIQGNICGVMTEPTFATLQ